MLKVGKFPLFGAFGRMHCSLKLIKLKGLELTERGITKLEYLQRKYFADLLGLKHPLLVDSATNSSSFLLVSLAKG
jgi:hypothetical protein